MVRSSLDKIMRKAITTRDLSAAYDRMLELLAESMKQVTQPERQGTETSPNQVVRCSTPPTVGINGATVGAFLHLATQHLDALRSDPLCQTRNPTTEEITQVLTKLLQLSGPPTWDSIPCSDGSPARCPAFVWDGSCVSTMIRALCLAPTEGLHVAWAFILKHLSSPALPIRRRDYECFFHLATPSTEDMTLLSTIRQHARAHDVELGEVDYIRYLRLVWQRAATDPSKWEKEALTITSDLFREIVRSGHILCFSQAMYDVLAGRDAPPILTRRVSQPYSKYVVEKVTLNNTCHPPIGRCPLCDATLQRYPFPEEYRKQLLQNLERLPLKGRSPHVSEQGNEKERLIEQLLNDFQKSAMQMGRIDVVIDGANVGYAGLSAWGARANEEQRREEALAMKEDLGSSPVGGSKRTRHVENEVSDESDLFWRRRPPVPVPARLEQVDAVLRELRQHFPEKRAVVVMHERHLEDAHVQPQYREMVKRWKECGSVLISPSGINDDHCWLYVAILHSNSEGQCPVWAVTNDLMRDHHYALMSQRSFLRWREVSCMKFHILAPGTFAQLVPPPAYSVVPQYDATTRRWHIPVRLEEEDLGTKSSLWHPIHWLCVNLEIE